MTQRPDRDPDRDNPQSPLTHAIHNVDRTLNIPSCHHSLANPPPTTASCLINTAAPPLCAHILLSLLLDQVFRVCVNTVRFFGRLALKQHQLHYPYADAMRVPSLWMPHHLTSYDLSVSSMLLYINTLLSNGGTTFRIHSNQHHRFQRHHYIPLNGLRFQIFLSFL